MFTALLTIFLGASSPQVITYCAAWNQCVSRSGGSVAWRHNNPGNLRWSSKQIGNIAGFSVFPDRDTGEQELTRVVSEIYTTYTIPAMMKKYAPSSENDTRKYTSFLLKYTGVSSSKKVGNLTRSQLTRLVSGIEYFEGWFPGTTKQTKSKIRRK